MHNQNACVCEELLKSMKDSDALNDILGHAHLVEVCNIQSHCQKHIFMANVKFQNIDLKVKDVAIVITVVPVTLQSIVQFMAKLVTIVIKRDTSSLFVEVASVASLVLDGREVRAKVDPGRTNMKFHHVIKLMTATGMHVNRILSRLCIIKVCMEISLTFALMR